MKINFDNLNFKNIKNQLNFIMLKNICIITVLLSIKV